MSITRPCPPSSLPRHAHTNQPISAHVDKGVDIADGLVENLAPFAQCAQRQIAGDLVHGIHGLVVHIAQDERRQDVGDNLASLDLILLLFLFFHLCHGFLARPHCVHALISRTAVKHGAAELVDEQRLVAAASRQVAGERRREQQRGGAVKGRVARIGGPPVLGQKHVRIQRAIPSRVRRKRQVDRPVRG